MLDKLKAWLQISWDKGRIARTDVRGRRHFPDGDSPCSPLRGKRDSPLYSFTASPVAMDSLAASTIASDLAASG